jgi:hypothetical protein
MNAADFVLLRLGPWALALPRRAVRDLMPPQAVGAAVSPAAGRAAIRFQDRELPLLLLGDDLRWSDTAPAGRRICVVLESDAGAFAMLCDEFEHRIEAGQGAVALHAVPAAMRTRASPVKAVLRFGDSVAAVTDANALRSCFEPHLGFEAAPA